jgi:hypothetical protein
MEKLRILPKMLESRPRPATRVVSQPPPVGLWLRTEVVGVFRRKANACNPFAMVS